MSVLEKAIGWLAPAQCINCGYEGIALCSDCADELIESFGERCWRCNSLSVNSRTCPSCRHTGSPAHVWIVTNYDNTARDLLGLYKFGHQRVVSKPISNMMAEVFKQYSLGSDYLVAPIPTATSRMRQRGFGHSELLAKNIAKELGMNYKELLSRYGQTRQLGSKREDRLKQLRHSFAVKNTSSVSGQRILLIDDVVTTGGTIIAAAKTLRAAGAKQVDALLFAKRL